MSFLLALMHLDRYLPPMESRPVLLIMDQLHGHMTIEVMEFCRRRRIILLFLPSRCTWCFQPLDVGVFHSFHSACMKLLAACLAQQFTINRNTIVSLYGAAAFECAFTPDVIKSAWAESGLFPINRGTFVLLWPCTHALHSKNLGERRVQARNYASQTPTLSQSRTRHCSGWSQFFGEGIAAHHDYAAARRAQPARPQAKVSGRPRCRSCRRIGTGTT